MHAACCGPNTWETIRGSSNVNVNGKALVREGDMTLHCGGMGVMRKGSTTVNGGG